MPGRSEEDIGLMAPCEKLEKNRERLLKQPRWNCKGILNRGPDGRRRPLEKEKKLYTHKCSDVTGLGTKSNTKKKGKKSK